MIRASSSSLQSTFLLAVRLTGMQSHADGGWLGQAERH